MRAILFQTTAGAVVGLATLVATPSTVPAQDAIVAPTYSRLRTGADDWRARGGHLGYGRGGYGYGYPFIQPYVSPVIAGNWYARPYPHHFDYFRGRWNGPAPASPSEWPCVEPASHAGDIAPAPDASPAKSY